MTFLTLLALLWSAFVLFCALWYIRGLHENLIDIANENADHIRRLEWFRNAYKEMCESYSQSRKCICTARDILQPKKSIQSFMKYLKSLEDL